MIEKGPGTADIEIEAGGVILWSKGVARVLVEACIGDAELESVLLVEACLEIIPGLQCPGDAGKLKEIVLRFRIFFQPLNNGTRVVHVHR